MEAIDGIYNSVAEIKLRILILLEHSRQEYLSTDMIAALDFITVYGHEFGVSESNLHGDNRFKFSELPSRREKAHEAIRELVLDGMLDIDLSKGFRFQINDKGYEYIEQLESEYAIEYGEIASKTCAKYGDADETGIYKMIQSKSNVPITLLEEK